MQMNEYQVLAQRTSPNGHDRLLNGCLGLAGESGECCDIVKKWLYQSHELDREKRCDELGDVLWYIAETATGLGISLEQIAKRNLEKLRDRYPNGFDPQRSIHRPEYEVNEK